MAEKVPHRVRFIEVQPSKDKKGDLPPFKGKNDQVMPDIHNNVAKNSKFVRRKTPIPKARKAVRETSFREVKVTMSNHVAREAKDKFTKEATDPDQQKSKKDDDQQKDDKGDDQPNKKGEDDEPKDTKDKKGNNQPKDKEGDHQLKDKKGVEDFVEGKREKRKKKKKTKRRKNKAVLPLDNESEQTGDTSKADASQNVVRGKKKKEQMETKHTKKTKDNKADINEGSVESASSEKAQTAEEAVPKDANSRRKLPCLFGFIATWIAKRKEKRREKKRKAIASRDPPKQLVEYEHRTARGGEAFTIELDSRPMTLKKPLLPPIKQTPGPILREKYHDADCRRYEKMTQRKDAAREHERKRTRCKENKAENDRQFRHKTELGIKMKQTIAERNREVQSRCKSRPRTHSTRLSPESLKEPSAESSLGSIYGPSLYYDNEVDRDSSDDIPVF